MVRIEGKTFTKVYVFTRQVRNLEVKIIQELTATQSWNILTCDVFLHQIDSVTLSSSTRHSLVSEITNKRCQQGAEGCFWFLNDSPSTQVRPNLKASGQSRTFSFKWRRSTENPEDRVQTGSVSSRCKNKTHRLTWLLDASRSKALFKQEVPGTIEGS